MNAWQTPNADDIDALLSRKLRRLATMQGLIERYETASLPVPVDIIAEYQRRADSLVAFADLWGFDIDDVLADGPMAS